jgi:hypothetical protein
MFLRLLRAFARHATDGLLNADETCRQTGCRVGPAHQTCNPITVVYHSAEWLTTLGRQRGQAGSYDVTAARRQHRGPPVRHHYKPSDATAPHYTTDRVQGGRRQDQTCPRRWRHHLLLLAIVPYSIGFDLPRDHLSGLGTHCNCSNLSYKRLRQAPLHRGRSEKRLRLTQAR